MPEGYRSFEFAASNAHEGRCVELRSSGSWLIERSVPGSPDLLDAVNCYPLLVCADWSALGGDLEALTGVVSVTAVTDPMLHAPEEVLRAAFPDLLRPYKQHLVVDLVSYDDRQPSAHHRRNVARGRRECTVARVEPSRAGDEWVALYAQLVARHEVSGRADLPDASLRAQLLAPGAMVWRADVDGQLAGMIVWMRTGSHAYYHLGAYTPIGYSSRAAFALFDAALRDLAESATHAVLGAGAGVDAGGEDDGLVRFKRGWGTSERVAYLGGRVVNRTAYDRLSGAHAAGPYFPSYRAPSDVRRG